MSCFSQPNAPKKPSGAYIWFCNEHRGKIKGEHSDWGVAEIGKELGALWKTQTDEDKKVGGIPFCLLEG